MCVVQCFVVSTLVSMTPAGPFLFRNYELPEAAEAHAKQVTDHPQLPAYGQRGLLVCYAKMV